MRAEHDSLLYALQILLFLFQVGNREVLNCYYAHADQEDQLQVRWARW